MELQDQKDLKKFENEKIKKLYWRYKQQKFIEKDFEKLIQKIRD